MKKKRRKTVVRKKQKRKFQKLSKKRTTISIKLRCVAKKHPFCKKHKGVWIIDTTNPDIYTEEVRKNWKCLLCKGVSYDSR